MNKFSKTVFVGLLSVMILGQTATVMAGEHRRGHRDHRDRKEDRDHRDDKEYRGHPGKHGKHGWCDRHARVRIRDLDVKPDPFLHGQPLKRWYVDAYLDAKHACKANVSIWEGRDLVARERHYKLQPGRNRIELDPEQRYRFHKKEHCFDVYFNLKGNRRRIDADRTFCAREVRAWTMKEGRRHQRRAHRR